jgi:hypothetical protein
MSAAASITARRPRLGVIPDVSKAIRQIHTRPERIWPWLVQLGSYRRAGWYSEDLLDRLGQRRADPIIPELNARS